MICGFVCGYAGASNLKRHRVDVGAFYNVAIDLLGRTIMMEDFNLWLSHRPRQFTFCQYPFLLSMGLKQSLLNEESKALLQRNAQHALASTMYHGRLVMPVFLLRVRRDHVMQDSINQIASASQLDLRKQLKVQFSGEEGIDAGGLKKEWFLIISRELFDPQFGMFTYDEESRLCWFNPATMESPDEYYLVGVLIGLAVLNCSVLADIPLPLGCYKKLLGIPVDLDDLAQFNPGLARGLKQLLNYEDDDLEDVFCRTFVGEHEAWGEVVSTPLIKNGDKIVVTKENRQLYVDRLTSFILTESIVNQFEHFKRGFDSVSRPSAALSLLRGEELELLIRGSIEELNIHDLRASTHHEGFSTLDAHAVEDFWDFFGKLAPERQRKLLAFITGSDRIPATGISGVQMKLVHGKDATRLPQARTCFNLLTLPTYPSREIFEEKMNRAIDESQGFGLK
ncbi:ubiquitin-protein ligase E3A [Atractiella rhizophila]|nr:ubiquitin-protein ligase E3A [Atractiella rhizophila]